MEQSGKKMDDNKQARENELAIAQINGEIRLVHERIDTIKKNDLYHIQKSTVYLLL